MWKLTGDLRESLFSLQCQEKKSHWCCSIFHRTCQNHAFTLGQQPGSARHVAPVDTAQWEAGWRMTDRIKVHSWVLCWHYRFAMSLCDADVIMCVTRRGLWAASVTFPTATPLWPCRRVPWANGTTLQMCSVLWWSRLRRQESTAPRRLLQADICVLLLVCSSSDKVLTRA